MAGSTAKRLFSETEEIEIVGVEDLDPVNFFVVGKVFASKVVHKEALFKKLKELWQTEGAFFFNDVRGTNLFLVRFVLEEDRQKILSGCPWSFDNALVAMKATDGRLEPQMEAIEKQELWVRIRGLPPRFLNKAMGKSVGDKIGEYVRTDEEIWSDFFGEYLRIRVKFDLSKPLPRWVKVRVRWDLTKNFDIEYEFLPHFCFFCGLLTHTGSCCPEKLADPSIQQIYGRKKTLIRDCYSINPESGVKSRVYGLSKKVCRNSSSETSENTPSCNPYGHIRKWDDAYSSWSEKDGDNTERELKRRRAKPPRTEAQMIIDGGGGSRLGLESGITGCAVRSVIIASTVKEGELMELDHVEMIMPILGVENSSLAPIPQSTNFESCSDLFSKPDLMGSKGKEVMKRPVDLSIGARGPHKVVSAHDESSSIAPSKKTIIKTQERKTVRGPILMDGALRKPSRKKDLSLDIQMGPKTRMEGFHVGGGKESSVRWCGEKKSKVSSFKQSVLHKTVMGSGSRAHHEQ